MSLLAAAAAACRSSANPEVVVHTADGVDPVVRVEIADDAEERNVGLMYRTNLPPDRGMLFLFEDEKPRAFWMKNTPLSLDILFLSSDGRIVGIAEQTTPFSLQPIPSGGPAERVLEVNAGFVKRNKITVGARVTYRGVP